MSWHIPFEDAEPEEYEEPEGGAPHTVYAELGEDNIVMNVAVFEDTKTPEILGLLGTWVIYEPEEGLNDVPPYDTWVKDENGEWHPPADKPYPEDYGEEGTRWYWNDTDGAWAWAEELEE